jgi:multicomponent Na+:H+ antiporter subunit B
MASLDHTDAGYGEESIILRMIVGLLYPFIMLFGFFLIRNGHYTPGGGFQGGAVLASLFVARFVVYPVDDTDSAGLHALQRLFLALIVLAPTALLFTGVVADNESFRSTYLTLMDILIGVQVGLGLGVAVLRFAFFEGVGQTWHL